jgi:alpha-tubulin suppressor-like RCC1 family protein
MGGNVPFGTVYTVPTRNVATSIVNESPFEGGGYSYDFNGLTDFLSVNGDESWAFGTGDFTIEWFQYQTDTNQFPRVFAIGTYPNTSIGFSNESGNIYVWLKNGNSFGSLDVEEYKDKWVHFAIVRNSGNLYLYKNGVQQGNTTGNNQNITDNTNTLYFGVETPNDNRTFFGGYLTNIRIVKGLAVYTGDFIVPGAALTLISSENPYGGSNTQAIPDGYTKLLLVPDPNNVSNPVVEEPQVPTLPPPKSGDVYVWGRPNRGGSPEGQTDNENDSGDLDKITQNINAKKICSTDRAFAALTESGDVYVWGSIVYGGSVEYDEGNGEVTKIEEEGFGPIKEIYSTRRAFAALTESGDVWVWGNPEYGGSSEYTGGNGNVAKIVADGFSNIKAIYSTDRAFAAVDNNGAVWVWGDPNYGAYPIVGEGSVQKIEPEGFGAVEKIYSNKGAFVALTVNGDVWVWGSSRMGGSPIYDSATGVYKIAALTNINIKAISSTSYIDGENNSGGAFAALTENGDVWVWGNPFYGGSRYYGIVEEEGEANGDIHQIVELSNIYEIYSTEQAFAAVQIESGAVYVWGNPFYGGSRYYGTIEGEANGNVAQIIELNNIKAIYSTEQAFAAVTQEGTVWVWGNPSYGGSQYYGIVEGEANGNIAPIEELTNIKAIYSTTQAFASLQEETGAVYVWGNPNYGGSRDYGNGGNIAQLEELTNIKAIYSTEEAFAALQEETGAVWVWGDPAYGGSSIYDENGDIAQLPNLQFVEAIYSTTRAFAAIVRFFEEPEPETPVTIYNIVKPVKSNYFSNVMNYLLFFPKN